jgi:hypothetical protein
MEERMKTPIEVAVGKAGRQVFSVARSLDAAWIEFAHMKHPGKRAEWLGLLADAFGWDMALDGCRDEAAFGAPVDPAGRAKDKLGRGRRNRVYQDLDQLDDDVLAEVVVWLAQENVDNARDALAEHYQGTYAAANSRMGLGMQELVSDDSIPTQHLN